uniref:Uncharacterized protein n=1 Tax=Brassica oleracea TaxID=3712 RepID=A0A3P6D8C9_BRAOL|nr:unnamed protein product [Brassica oleracea]
MQESIETEQTVMHCVHNQPNSNFLCTETQLIRLAAFPTFLSSQIRTFAIFVAVIHS